MTLHHLLAKTMERGGSDLHLTAGAPPSLRVDGELVRFELPELGPEQTKTLVYSALSETQRQAFEDGRELDFALSIHGVGRCRGNVFRQQGLVGAVFRLIPQAIRSLDDLGLPPVVGTLADRPRGLVLVTGPTGSGKSATLAAMVDRINATRAVHILTIEDPVEYVHRHKRAVVNQRELGFDTLAFPGALRAALRQDPDVVLIGELRDVETMQAALTMAETGHLTMGTVHTNSAAQTITRLVDACPAHQQGQVRTQLSLVLEGIVCQALVRKAAGAGRVAVVEVLVATPAIRHLIRDDKVHQIYGAMQTGQDRAGMQTMNQALVRLVERRLVTRQDAMAVSANTEELATLLDRAGLRHHATPVTHPSDPRGLR